jgi:hypothetical protein
MTKSAIGMTIHYDDGTVQKMPISVVVNILAENTGRIAGQPAGRGNANWLNADECPIHGPWKAIAAGSNQERGTTWQAFWTCDTAQGDERCTNKPAREWTETHPAARAAAGTDTDTPPPPNVAQGPDDANTQPPPGEFDSLEF